MMKASRADRRRPLPSTRDETVLRITYARGPRPGVCPAHGPRFILSYLSCFPHQLFRTFSPLLCFILVFLAPISPT